MSGRRSGSNPRTPTGSSVRTPRPPVMHRVRVRRGEKHKRKKKANSYRFEGSDVAAVAGLLYTVHKMMLGGQAAGPWWGPGGATRGVAVGWGRRGRREGGLPSGSSPSPRPRLSPPRLAGSARRPGRELGCLLGVAWGRVGVRGGAKGAGDGRSVPAPPAPQGPAIGQPRHYDRPLWRGPAGQDDPNAGLL